MGRMMRAAWETGSPVEIALGTIMPVEINKFGGIMPGHRNQVISTAELIG
jgi:hypothetical protein